MNILSKTIAELFCICCFFVGSFCVSGLWADEPNWNQFRGPKHDNHSFSTGIAKSWPKEGPKLLWQIDNIGEGYSNVVFYGDLMFTMGDVGDDCMLFALNKNDGKEIWKAPVGDAGMIGRYIGPRSTPAVDGERVFAYGQYGDFVCFDMKTGKELWGGNVADELGGRYMSNWGFSSSPIFDDDLVLLPVGGQDGTLVAFRKDGQRAWRSAGLTDGAPYSSVVPAMIAGQKQYLLFSGSGLHGIDSKSGNRLWSVSRFSERPVCSDPIAKDDIVLIASAYGMGANAYRIADNDGLDENSSKKDSPKFSVEEIYADRSLLNHHGGMILVDDHVYLTADRDLFCIDLKTGKVAWRNRSVGKGSVSYVDGHLIVRSEKADGEVALVEATPEEYREKGRFDEPDDSDKHNWTYPVLVDGRMYLRDQNVLRCYDLGRDLSGGHSGEAE